MADCPVQRRVRPARCCDPLGDYPVALCPLCGADVPLQPHQAHADAVPVPGHRLRSP